MNQIQFITFDKVTNIFHISSECESDDDCTAPQVCLDTADSAPNTCAICNDVTDCDTPGSVCHSDGATGCVGKSSIACSLRH